MRVGRVGVSLQFLQKQKNFFVTGDNFLVDNYSHLWYNPAMDKELMSYREIAEQLNLSEKQVRTAAKSGVKKLEKLMEDQAFRDALRDMLEEHVDVSGADFLHKLIHDEFD